MKTLLILLAILTLSCSKEQQETAPIKLTTFLPVGIQQTGEPEYMQIIVDGVLYESPVEDWQSTFNLPLDGFEITSVQLFGNNEQMLYQGVGYYDLEVRHYLTKENPLKVNKTAFNEIGLSVSVFPCGW